MKTALDLRPVYHKSDVAYLAHLHLGILAYWVVTSIRYQLCQKGINKTWSQILDIMLTQKSVTSEAKNLQDEPIHIEQCSEPTTEVSQIYDNISISHKPPPPKKICVDTNSNSKKTNRLMMMELRDLLPAMWVNISYLDSFLSEASSLSCAIWIYPAAAFNFCPSPRTYFRKATTTGSVGIPLATR